LPVGRRDWPGVGIRARIRLARSDHVGRVRCVPKREGLSRSSSGAGRPGIRRSLATMPQMTRLDRVRGCMLGLAIGDALGAPLAGLSAEQIRAHYGQVIDFVDGARAWKRKPYRWRMPGLYSDDTQQALALSDVLLEHGRVEPERLAEIYLGLANPKGTYVGAHRGVGRSFRQVLADLQRGVSPRQTGQTSAGIGAAMRIAPVALYFNGEPEAMFEAAMAASLMTHRDIRSLAGAMSVAHAVRRLAAGDPRDPSFLFRVAA